MRNSKTLEFMNNIINESEESNKDVKAEVLVDMYNFEDYTIRELISRLEQDYGLKFISKQKGPESGMYRLTVIGNIEDMESLIMGDTGTMPWDSVDELIENGIITIINKSEKLDEKINKDNVEINDKIRKSLRSKTEARKNEPELAKHGIEINYNSGQGTSMKGPNGRYLSDDRNTVYGPTKPGFNHTHKEYDDYYQDRAKDASNKLKKLQNMDRDDIIRKYNDRSTEEALATYKKDIEEARKNYEYYLDKGARNRKYTKNRRKEGHSSPLWRDNELDKNEFDSPVDKVDYLNYLTKKPTGYRGDDNGYAYNPADDMNKDIHDYEDLKYQVYSAENSLDFNKKYYPSKSDEELEADANEIRAKAEEEIERKKRDNDVNKENLRKKEERVKDLTNQKKNFVNNLKAKKANNQSGVNESEQLNEKRNPENDEANELIRQSLNDPEYAKNHASELKKHGIKYLKPKTDDTWYDTGALEGKEGRRLKIRTGHDAPWYRDINDAKNSVNTAVDIGYNPGSESYADDYSQKDRFADRNDLRQKTYVDSKAEYNKAKNNIKRQTTKVKNMEKKDKENDEWSNKTYQARKTLDKYEKTLKNGIQSTYKDTNKIHPDIDLKGFLNAKKHSDRPLPLEKDPKFKGSTWEDKNKIIDPANKDLDAYKRNKEEKRYLDDKKADNLKDDKRDQEDIAWRKQRAKEDKARRDKAYKKDEIAWKKENNKIQTKLNNYRKRMENK